MFALNLYGSLFAQIPNTAWKRGVKAIALSMASEIIRTNGCDTFITTDGSANGTHLDLTLEDAKHLLFQDKNWMEVAKDAKLSSQQIANLLLPAKSAQKNGRCYKPPYGTVYSSWTEMLAFAYKAAWVLVCKEVTSHEMALRSFDVETERRNNNVQENQ